ncbi:MAG: hypothetical protein GXP26_18320 [Planctomycetes bacterium]|nr:hypothetical protein [Planctomycetota bacterium]
MTVYFWKQRTRVLLWAVGMLAILGCSGSDSQQTPPAQAEQEDAEQQQKNLAEKKKRNDREIQPLLALLGQEFLPESDGSGRSTGKASHRLLVKPGHWTTTVQEMKSNDDDFVGVSSTTCVDASQQPTTLEHTNFTLQSTRPVALAKGRMKRVESPLFIPEQSNVVQVRATLRNRATGRSESMGRSELQKMPSYQYFVLVLSKEISKYGFLKVADAIRMPWEEEFDVASHPHYRVVLADATKSLPLPSSLLMWTSLSHLVWDEVDPTRLTPEQQVALVDWLHWGGRLIINGPDSLETLRDSFLAEFLPAHRVGPRALTTTQLSEWSAYWSRRDQGEEPPQLKPTKPWSGVRLQPKADARELAGGAELFYERGVGRGTVVVSAIQLVERDLINWPGYDSFLSAALLRRPRRIFSEGPYGGSRINWAEYADRRLDAHFVTGLRMFARDASTSANPWRIEVPAGKRLREINAVTTAKTNRPGGLGSWSFFNSVANAARAVLTDAAAVRVPGGSFVLACLGLYLVVLVPLNWMVFRTLDRLEWAWIAAPVIAVLGTLVIVRQAQLDIGFVRSQTEVALLELQGAYPRGLLSRFTALYSSLSTTYDVTFDAPTAVATPFPTSREPRPSDETIWNVVFEKQNETRLHGLAVSSASTKMVHSEEMFALAGPLRLSQSSRGHDQLENRLGYHLHNVMVVRRTFAGGATPKYESSWIGELRDGNATVIGFRPLLLAEGQARQRKQAARVDRAVQVDVEALLEVAWQFPTVEDPLESRRDECRVVACIDQVLPGTKVSPAASQIVGATVVLAHFDYGPLPQPEPDVNSPKIHD